MNMPLVLLNRRRRGGSFSPYSLFSGTAIGTWFDPSDLSTMYQDAAGTTAVTTPGQPVGLRLDKSKGLALGAELVANGDFAEGSTGWSVGTDWTISGGLASRGPNATASNLIGGSGVEAGKYYRVTWTQGNDFVAVYLGSLAGPLVTTTSLAGTYTRIVLATTAGGIAFRASNAVSLLDNVSVKELPGNHATQSVLASRPVYGIEPAGGRRNLLTFSEQFDNAVWSKVSATVTANATVAPDGTTTADLYVPAAGTVSPELTQNLTGLTSGAAYASSVYLKDTGNGSGWFELTTTNPITRSWFDIRNGAKGNGPGAIQAVGSGWYRCALPTTLSSTGTTFYITPRSANGNIASIVATAVPYAEVWGAQLELGSTATAYQRVTSAFDVTEAGVQSCHYVQYDGSDDGMITNSIDFTATDKMSVFAGVNKQTDATAGIFIELSVSAALNNGVFTLATGTANGFTNGYASGARGVIAASNNQVAGVSSLPAPNTSVLSMTHDIAGDLSTMRVNAVAGTSGTGDKGTGTFGNYPLYLGRRGGTTLPFNGRDYGIVIVGKATTADEITSTERWLAGKTGFYAPIITGVPTIGVS